jgi:hypothetical protein
MRSDAEEEAIKAMVDMQCFFLRSKLVRLVNVYHCTYDQRVMLVTDRTITSIRAILCRW